MPPAPAIAVVDLLRQHRLLEPAQLAELPALQTQFLDPRMLAKELVRRGWITPYQANQLVTGHVKHLVLGPYALLEKLGEGGMGQVFKARHQRLGRIDALKVIRKERLDNPDAIKRFYREIRAASALKHPNIVHAIDADEVDGTHYFSMEYVEGEDLATVVKKRGPLPVAEACACIRQAAVGLQHAFERGLVHRDIKPHNLLLSIVHRPSSMAKMEGSSDMGPWSRDHGQLKILDLGLARLDARSADDRSSTMTQEGAIMGTPDYIAPEQARSSHGVDIRADLYSVGCTFYFLLTGNPPFPGGSLTEKLLKHQLEEPIPVEFIRSQIPVEVVNIVRKLMAKKSEARYQTPAELVAALDSLGSPSTEAGGPSESISSGTQMDDTAASTPPESAGKTLSLVEQLRQKKMANQLAWERKFLRGAVIAAGVVILVLAGWGVSRLFKTDTPPAPPVVQETRPGDKKAEKKKPPTAEEVAAEAEKKRIAEAEDAFKPLEAKSKASGVTFEAFAKEVAAFKAKYGGTPAAINAAARLMELPSPLDQLDPAKIPEDAKAAWKASGFDGKDVVGVLGEHRQRHWGSVAAVAYSPARDLVASLGQDRVLRLWSSETLDPVGILRSEGLGFNAMSFDLKGKHLLTGRAGLLELWDVEKRQRTIELVTPEDDATALAFVSDTVVVTGGRYGRVSLWDLSAGKLVRSLGTHTHQVTSVVVLPNGKEAYSASHDGKVHFIDLDTGTVSVFEGHGGSIHGIVIEAKGKRAVTAGEGMRLLSWDLPTRKPLQRFDPPPQPHSLALRPGSSEVVTGNGDGTITRWDFASHKAILTWQAHAANVDAVSYSRDGKRIVSGSADGTVRLWEVDTGKEVQPLTGPVGAINTVAFSADARRVLTAGRDQTARLCELPDGKQIGQFPADTAWLLPGDCGNLGRGPGSAIRWFDATAQVSHEFGPATWAAVSPDVKTLILGHPGGLMDLWELAGNKPLQRHQFKAHDSNVHCMAFTPDGRKFVSTGDDHHARVWELTAAGPRQLAVLGLGIGQGSNANHVAVSPDGNTLAVAFEAIWLFDLSGASPTKTGVLPGSSAGFAFYPDGKRLASVSGPQSRLTIWDVWGHTKLREWQLPGPVHAVAFAADGRHLATANGNGTVYVLRIGERPEGYLYPGQTLDLLPLIDAAQDRVRGEWTVGEALSSKPSGNATINVPVSPKGSYEWQASFTRTAGKYSINFGFPVGTAPAGLVLAASENGDISGIGEIKGKGPDQNSTRVRPAGIFTGKRHEVLIRVLLKDDQATIEVELDGKPYTRWTGSPADLSVPAASNPRLELLAVGSYEGTTIFHELKLRMLGGNARLSRPPPAAHVGVSPAADDFVRLFNGKDLTGWRLEPQAPDDWKVVNGVLVGRGSIGFLRSVRADFGDFHLRTEVRINAKGDSGIVFRGAESCAHRCYEAQLLPAGGVSSAAILKFEDKENQIQEGYWPSQTPIPADRWIVHELIVKGNHVLVRIDGKTTVECLDATPFLKGRLALQIGLPETTVEFRKIEIKELLRPLSPDQAKQQQADAAKQLGVPVTIENSVGMKLNLIPAGKFLMGSPETEVGRIADREGQTVMVMPQTFLLGQFEVTQDHYQKIVGKNPSGMSAGPDHPVENLTLKEAMEFCRKLSALTPEKAAGRAYRLPTEPEWEYACRAGSQMAYSFGNGPGQLKNHGWYAENSNGMARQVGQKLPNAWGLHDMHGKVLELTVLGAQAQGGSFGDGPALARSAYRANSHPDFRASTLGFRVVCEIKR